MSIIYFGELQHEEIDETSISMLTCVDLLNIGGESMGIDCTSLSTTFKKTLFENIHNKSLKY